MDSFYPFFGGSPLSIFGFIGKNQNREEAAMKKHKGLTITSGRVTICKNRQNVIGLSIGGGYPDCPVIYIVQIFDKSPAAEDGSLAAGDEITRVNNWTCAGLTKHQVAERLRATKYEVTIYYNKLHVDLSCGKSMDMILKKLKHRVTERISSDKADILGLSRAILHVDLLAPKLKELDEQRKFYKELIHRYLVIMNRCGKVSRVILNLGNYFNEIGAKAENHAANELFSEFGQAHRGIGLDGAEMVKSAMPIIKDLRIFTDKLIPDVKLTIKKYLDIKFEYLSFCLKVRELDEFESECRAVGLTMPEVEEGNWYFRLILRCREMSRKRFAASRSDVLTKLELLDQKRMMDLVEKLRKLTEIEATHCSTSFGIASNLRAMNPIEIDLAKICNYQTTGQLPPQEPLPIDNDNGWENDETIFEDDEMLR